MTDQKIYDLKSVKLPVLQGGALKAFASALEGPLGGLLSKKLMADAGIADFRNLTLEEVPTLKPIHMTGRQQSEVETLDVGDLPTSNHQTPGDFRFNTILDFASGYTDGAFTPVDIAEKVIAAIEDSNASSPPLRAVIFSLPENVREQAEASAQRIKEGKRLSLVDGIPIVIKDELDAAPYFTTGGTSFLGKTPAIEDATVVERLRAAGAIIVGKANMHEIGINVFGFNEHHGAVRNPYNPDHFSGGSSSGPAVAVAAGLCPVAIGADGGGSIRVPSAFNGMVGLKSTFGRISEHGAVQLDWSVAHIGPIAATATDVAVTWGLMAGADPRDPDTWYGPKPDLTGWDNMDLSDLTLGVFWPWFRHASADKVTTCENILGHFQQMGAKIKEIAIPDLEMGRVAHTITIASEMSQAMDEHYDQHRKDFGLDVRVNLALARRFTSMDYIKSQRARTRLTNNFLRVFEEVDMVITPTTGIPSPPIPKGALPLGNSDLATTLEIMRYAQPANLTGLPAIAFPVGYNPEGMPLSMQAMGRPWEEKTLLRLALAAEQHIGRVKPMIYYDLIGDQGK